MKKHFYLLSILFSNFLAAQTVPSAQSLIYTQDFSSLSSSSTTYTTGFQGWAVGSSSSSSFRTTAPTGDQALNGSSSASTTTGGVHNYNGKIGILASGSVDPSLAFVVNTTGFTNVQVTFDIMTIRNPYDGGSNTRKNNVELQYLVGSSVGAFTDASGSIYRNNTTTQTGSGVTTPQNVKTITITLPSGCNNQSAVQLRWVQRDSSGSGSRASFAFDNICVTGTSSITASGSTTFCSGGSVSLTAVTGSSYVWSTGATTRGITAMTSGTYSVTTTQATGCSSASSPVTVTVNSAPTPTLTASPSFTICNGQSTTLTASGATSYSWNTGATTSTLSVNPTTTTVYTVTVTNSGGCSATATKTVTVSPINVAVTPTSTTICSGTNTTLTASGATTYAWSPSTGLNITTGTTVIASPTTSTTYTVTGTSGSCSNTQTSAVTVNPVNTITVSPSSASICIGSSTNLTASGSTSYSWSPSTGLNTTIGATVTANPTITTTYTVTGSCNQKTNVTVTVNPLPTLTVTFSPSSTICSGTNTTLTASGATTYAWSPSTGLSSTTGTSVTASPTTTITYTVTGTNSNGCIGTKTVSVTVNSLPSVAVSPTSTSICNGTNTTLTASGATTYAWSPSTGLNSTTGSSVTASPTATTTYTVTGTGSNGCTNNKTVVVTINSIPTVSVSPTNPAVCNGSSATLTASGATTYAWSPSTALNTTTGATVIASPTTNITYMITGTTNGCSAVATLSVSVTTASGGTAHASGGSDVCSNSAVSLTLTGQTGTFVKWQSSTDNINYADVPGGTTQNYSTSVNTSTYFRAQVTSGSCPVVYSAAAYYITNNNYYVNDNSTSGDIFCTAVGSSGNDGRSPSRPMSSINSIFSTYTIGACDTIFVDKGTFTEEVNIFSSDGGNSHGYATIFGAGVSNTVLNAPASSHNIYIGTNYIKIQNLSMNNTHLSYYNVEMYEAAHNIITNTKLSHTADANVVIFGDNINSNGNQILINSITNSSNANSTGIYNGIFVEGNCDSLVVQSDSITMSNANTIDAILITTYSNGSTNYYPSHGLINQNIISAYTYGVSLYGYDYPIATYTVSSNTITMQANTTTDGGPVWLGSVGSSSAYQSVIYDNRLIGGKNGIYCAFSANYSKSYNNYISGSAYGLYVYDVTSNNNELYFNSFYNTTNNLFYYSTSCSSWNVRNNILYNTGSSSSNACMNLGASSTYTVCDYNLFYNPNGASVGKIGSNTYSTLTAWKAIDHASGTPMGDEHSQSGNPLYANASSNNLDITSSSPASATGTTISGITNDIYNHTRTSPPSIGADDVPPVPTITAAPSLTICSGTSETLLANAGGGNSPTYIWNPGGATTSAITVNPIATTNYSVQITYSGGYSVTVTKTITVNPLPTPTVTASPSFTICNGQTTTLTASGGTSYSWNTGATTAALAVNPSITTSYTVIVTNSNGCTAIATKTVTVSPLTLTIAPSTAITICSGNSTNLTASGASSYAWSPSTGLNTTTGSTVTANPTATTTYTVSATSSVGCSATSTITVTVHSIPIVNAGSGGTICAGSNFTLNGSASGGTSPYTYSWSPSASLNNSTSVNPVASPTITASYTLTVTNVYGCTNTSAVNVNVSRPSVNADSALISFITGTLPNATGGTPPYTYAWSPPTSSDNPLLLPTSTTTYSLTVTDANGCSSTDTANFVPSPSTAGSCGALFISEYVQDTLNHDDAIEIYNPTSGTINLGNYYLGGTTNGSIFSPAFMFKLSGTVAAHKTFLITNTHADTALTNRANLLIDSLKFEGSDIVALLYIAPTSSSVQLNLLDKIGDFTIAPTNNGWAVGSGSTKNHTLVRKITIVEGNPNWITCQNEWNVFPMGTFSYLGHYKNVCTPGDASLYLDLGSTYSPLGCNSPNPYFHFEILASSDSIKIFNSCKMRIQFTEAAFGKIYTSGTNKNITVTEGTTFSSSVYGSPTLTSLDDSTIEISFGDPSNPITSGGTTVDATQQVLLNIDINTNNCSPSDISFYDNPSTIGLGYFTDKIPQDSIDCTNWSYNYTAGDVTCGYNNDPNDSIHYGDPEYGHHVPYDVYNIVQYYQTVNGSSTISSSSCSPWISNWTGQINPSNGVLAGTSDILTIHGSGFGGSLYGNASITVADANSNSFFSLDTSDIIHGGWTDKEIKIKFPSVMLTSLNTPGSGTFSVFNPCNDFGSSNLNVYYNTINFNPPFTSKKLKTNLTYEEPSSQGGSFYFRCDTSISNNAPAYACVKKAITHWNCVTGVNWILGPPDSLSIANRHSSDGVSYIYFSDADATPKLALTFLHPILSSSCLNSDAFASDGDIAIEQNLYPWSYDTSGTAPPSNQYSFYQNILHELGHVHLLNHVNSTSDLMYRALAPGSPFIDITTWPSSDQAGARNVIDTSSTVIIPPCSSVQMVPIPNPSCSSLGVHPISENIYQLQVFPNPLSNGSITISYELSKSSSVQFKIVDYLGREIIVLHDEKKTAGSYKEKINLSEFSAGVYLLTANINGEYQAIKIIKQ